MGRSKVTADKKIEIKTLLEIGFCQRQVARDLHVSQTCIAHVSKKLKHNLPLSNSIGQENNEPFNFVPRVQGGGGTVSVWECMSGDARGPIMIYTDKMNGPAYIKTIQDALPMFIENTFDT
ncbi:unnamed protein product, partial [Rotaria socialis]